MGPCEAGSGKGAAAPNQVKGLVSVQSYLALQANHWGDATQSSGVGEPGNPDNPGRGRGDVLPGGEQGAGGDRWRGAVGSTPVEGGIVPQSRQREANGTRKNPNRPRSAVGSGRGTAPRSSQAGREDPARRVPGHGGASPRQYRSRAAEGVQRRHSERSQQRKAARGAGPTQLGPVLRGLHLRGGQPAPQKIEGTGGVPEHPHPGGQTVWGSRMARLLQYV